MLQKQEKSHSSKVISHESSFNPNEMQKFKDSRPSTPLSSDGVINAAKIRLSQKRSSSRVSSCSENSLSSDREIKSKKISRSNSEQCSNSNGAEIIDSCENPATIVDSKEGETPSQSSEEVQCDTRAQLVDESACKEPCEEIFDQPVAILSRDDSTETRDCDSQIESQVECTPPPPPPSSSSLIDESVNLECETEIESKTEVDTGKEEAKTEKETEIILVSEDIDNGDETNVEMNSENQVQTENEEEEIDLKSPLDELIKAATILNPRQFELPRELAIFPQFPGDEKSKLVFDFFTVPNFKELFLFSCF